MASNRIGDNLFANTRARARRAHRQAHLAFPGREARSLGLGFSRGADARDGDARRPPVDAVAQITKTGYVYVFERETGKPLFPIEYRKVPASTLDGERAAETQPYPVKPPPFARQTLTEDMLDDAHAGSARGGAQDLPRIQDAAGCTIRRIVEGTIIFPGVDGGGEWGGPAFDPETGLLYVNANEMPWMHKLVPRNDKSLFGSNCASCHGDDLKGSPRRRRRSSASAVVATREQLAQIIRQGTGRMPGLRRRRSTTRAVNDLVNFLITGHDVAETAPDESRTISSIAAPGSRSFSIRTAIRRSRRRGERSTRSI